MATRAPITFPDGGDMADLLAQIVAGVAGGGKATWRKRIGSVQRLPTWKHVTHNWRVSPSGTAEQRDMIERAVAVVRAEHPYIQ